MLLNTAKNFLNAFSDFVDSENKCEKKIFFRIIAPVFTVCSFIK